MNMSGRLAPIAVLLILPATFVCAVAADAPATGGDAVADYVIGVEDKLNISVWKETDLTRVLTVRPDGNITFPLVGDLRAAGKTSKQLDDELTKALGIYIREPVVTVIVEEINNFKVFMIGEVKNQGALVLRRRTRLLEAIAQAGGLTPFADKASVQVVREEDGRETRIKVDYRKVLSGERPDLNLYLKPGDTVIAN